MRLALAVAAGLGLAAALLAAGGAWYLRSRPAAPPEPEVDYPVGDFSLTERSGKVVSRGDLLGKVWVASFVFTRCTGPCPQVSGTMARLQHDLAGYGGDVKLVTFTVDPGHDDPQKLCCYADNYAADPDRWLFLTGPEADVYRLVHEGFHLPAEKRADSPDPGQSVDHSTRLAVVDRRSHVRGYFSGARLPESDDPEKEYEAGLDRLKRKVAELAREAP
jgi:cytochrome oxidase Cu insertion factor (SCO1/SenC/PrrC family)